MLNGHADHQEGSVERVFRGRSQRKDHAMRVGAEFFSAKMLCRKRDQADVPSISDHVGAYGGNLQESQVFLYDK